MKQPEIIKIDEVEYVRKDQVEDRIVLVDSESSLAGSMVGKPVIVRSRNEGINVGIVEAADETGVILKSARRLWYHKPSAKGVSWYEGVAMNGLSSDSKISATVIRKVIIEDYSMTECAKSAFDQIMSQVPHGQN